MALILSIDTSTEFASIALSNKNVIIGYTYHEQQKNHGAFLQPAIKQICEEASVNMNDLQAIAVANGPGSYTGLRIGLTSAKGLCYALNIPLITVSTLQVIAKAAKEEYSEKNMSVNTVFCPMIDARRMEVFTAFYNKQLELIEQEQPFIISENSFVKELNNYSIVFCGNGHFKVKNMFTHPNALFSSKQHSAKQVAELAFEFFKKNMFSNLAYTEPNYIKAFFTG